MKSQEEKNKEIEARIIANMTSKPKPRKFGKIVAVALLAL